jgi:hypothetical protein
MAETDNFGASLADWRNALQKCDPFTARLLIEEVDPYARLKSLGINAPAYVGYETVEEYFVDPSQATDILASQDKKLLCRAPAFARRSAKVS